MSPPGLEAQLVPQVWLVTGHVDEAHHALDDRNDAVAISLDDVGFIHPGDLVVGAGKTVASSGGVVTRSHASRRRGGRSGDELVPHAPFGDITLEEGRAAIPERSAVEPVRSDPFQGLGLEVGQNGIARAERHQPCGKGEVARVES